MRGYYLEQVAITAGTFINSQVISRLFYDRAGPEQFVQFGSPTAAIYICIGKQICPADNG